MGAIPTELLHLIKKYSTRIYRGTVVTAVVSILAMIIAVTSVYGGHLADSIFFIFGCCIFLLLYFVQHWMFVRPIQAQYASEPATPLDILLPVLVFAVLGSFSVTHIYTALTYLNAPPDYIMSAQPGEWRWRDYAPLFLFFIIIVGFFAFSRPRMLVLPGLAMLQLVLGWTSIMLHSSAFLGMAESTPIYLKLYYLRLYNGQEWILPVTIFSLFVLHLCFALGVLADILRLQPSAGSDGERRLLVKIPGSPASSYLSSARMFSFVLIVFMLLAFDVARSSVNRVSFLREARDMFALQITRDVLAKQPSFQIADASPESDRTPVGQPVEFPTYGKAEVRVRLSAEPVTLEKTGLSAQYKVRAGYEVSFSVYGGRKWRSRYEEKRTTRGNEDPRKWVEISNAMPQDFARILRYIGQPVDEEMKGRSPSSHNYSL